MTSEPSQPHLDAVSVVAQLLTLEALAHEHHATGMRFLLPHRICRALHHPAWSHRTPRIDIELGKEQDRD